MYESQALPWIYDMMNSHAFYYCWYYFGASIQKEVHVLVSLNQIPQIGSVISWLECHLAGLANFVKSKKAAFLFNRNTTIQTNFVQADHVWINQHYFKINKKNLG